MNTSEIQIYLDKARDSREKKDLMSFAGHIAIAKYLAKDTATLRTILEEEVKGLYSLYQYPKVLSLVDEAIELMDDAIVRLNLVRIKGLSLARTGEYQAAIEIFQQLAEEEDRKVQIWGYGNLGLVYLLIAKFKLAREQLGLAEEYCLKGLELSKEFDQKLYTECLRNLGNVYWYNNQFSKALKTFLEVQKHNCGDDPKNLNNIAATYVSLRDINLAEKYVDMAEMLAERERDLFEIAQSNLIRGRIEEEVSEDFIKAKDFYLVAFDYYIEAHALQDALKTYSRIVRVDQKINEESVHVLVQKMGSHLGMKSES